MLIEFDSLQRLIKENASPIRLLMQMAEKIVSFLKMTNFWNQLGKFYFQAELYMDIAEMKTKSVSWFK